MKPLVVAVVAMLLAPVAARAHVVVEPGLLESGEEVELRIELPELRPGTMPSSVAVSGEGVRQLSSRAAGVVGRETRWRVRVRVDAAPGPVVLLLRAGFPDGRTVDVRRTVTVVPASADGGAPVAAVAASAVGLALLLAAAVALRRRAGAR